MYKSKYKEAGICSKCKEKKELRTSKPFCCMDCHRAYHRKWQNEHYKKTHIKTRKYKEEILAKGICTKCNKGSIHYTYGPFWCIECLREKRLATYHRQIQGLSKGGDMVKWRAYTEKCKRRDIEFSLSLDQFLELINSDCNYCGCDKSMGIDRVNNEIGYTKSNVVSCCKQCNYAKRDLSLSEFMVWLDKIAKFQGYGR